MKNRRRTGFTLVEILVVVTIIAILAALILSGVYAVIPKVHKTQIAVETANLTSAIEQYKNELGDYPPDFSDPNMVDRHLRKIFPRNGAFVPGSPEEAAWIHAKANVDPAEALVFWLAMLSNDPILPLSNSSDSVDPTNPQLRTNRKQWFNFNRERLFDIDHDGYPEYASPHSLNAPYVYFDFRTYANQACIFPTSAATTPPPSASTTPDPVDWLGVTRPYWDSHPAPDGNPTFMNPRTYQIISASVDGHFGSGLLRDYPLNLNNNYTKFDMDNITNFSDGNTLGEKLE